MTIALKNISRQFSQKKALDDISVTFASGRIHALVGENGAGKSTLASILCGDKEPSSGSILIDGKEVSFKNPHQASDKGIVLVQQRPLLADELSVKENILLGSEHCPASYTSDSIKKLPQRFIMARLDLYAKQWAPNLKMNTLVRNIGGDERFFTSLLGALCRNPQFLILDEPSVFLNEVQRQDLYKNLRELAEKGTTILVITHSMNEAQNNTDTVTSLAKGKLIAHYEDSSLFKEGCEGYIKSVPLEYSIKGSTTSKANPFLKENFISFSNVTVRPINRPALFNISFTVKSSGITLIQGLAESGLGTLEDLVSGMIQSPCTGQMTLSCNTDIFQNEAFTIDLARTTLTPAILRGKNKRTTAIISSNRMYRSANPELTIEQLLGVYYTGKKLSEYVKSLIKKADISIQPTERVSKLSGGMLQRLILARELDVNPKFLILCEPLQGLDSTAASSMCLKLAELASEGKAVLVLTASNFPEKLCSSIYTLSDGMLTLKNTITEAE